jgi:hypothetical protein
MAKLRGNIPIYPGISKNLDTIIVGHALLKVFKIFERPVRRISQGLRSVYKWCRLRRRSMYTVLLPICTLGGLRDATRHDVLILSLPLPLD